MTSNFNYSLTKKRITMISKNISKRKSIVNTLASLLMIAAIILFYGFNNRKLINPVFKHELQSGIADTMDFVPSILPLKAGGDYKIGSSYGMRKDPYTGKMKKHVGIDIVADMGTEVVATAEGKVVQAKYDGLYGNCIKIQHGEKYVTLYAHLSGFTIKPGDKVKTNDVIGYVGTTGISRGSHLHYEVRKYPENKPVVFYDPADYIRNIREIPSAK